MSLIPPPLVVLSGPSGVGKNSVANFLLQHPPQGITLEESVSATTRQPRPGETEGKDYFFKTRPQFEQMIEQHQFLEHAEFNGNLYGTPLQGLQQIQDKGHWPLLVIEIEGAKTVRKLVQNALRIFIKPPSLEVLQARLTGRGTDSPTDIQKRLNLAEQEMAAADQFDYVVVNHTIEQCAQKISEFLLNHAQK
jgi:guanylate kinase